MARRVKCVDTEEYSTSDVAYKAPTGKYFSSEESYKKWECNKTYRQKCIDKMYEIMGYKPKMVLPTFFFKKLKDFEGVGFEALYNTMCSTQQSVDWALKNKNFNGETAKVIYILAIYNNHVMDEYKKLIVRDKMIAKSKSEVREDYVPLTIDDGLKKKGTDVSSLLGDEDWI